MKDTNNADSTKIGSEEKTSNIGFPIKFAAREFGGRPAFNSFSLRGKGEIVFKDNKIVLTGKRARPFWFGYPEEHVLDANSICDVRAHGKVVIFRIENANEPINIVSFTTNDKDISQAIAAHLPSRQTTEFIQHQKEQSDFNSRLDAISPRVWVTPTLVAMNVLMFVVMALNGAGVLQPNGEVAVEWGSNYGPMTLSGDYWRLLSSTFIHFGILHLALNMFALYQTGILVERLYGNFYFLVLYVFAGLSGSLVSILWHPTINSAGASGAIFGVFGGLLAFILSSHTQIPQSIVVAHRNSTVAFIGYNLFNGFAHAGIDNGAHLGGLAGGLIMGFILARPINEEARRIAWHRLAAGIAFAILIVITVTYAFFPPRYSARRDLAFEKMLRETGSKETKANSEYDEIIKTAKESPTGSPDDYHIQHEVLPQQLEQKILPQLDDMYNAVESSQLDEGSKYLVLRQALLRYCDDRRKQLRSVARALRTQSTLDEERAKDDLDEVRKQSEILKGLVKAMK